MKFIQKAIVDAIDNKPKDFYNNIEKAATEKMKVVIDRVIKEKEKDLFKKV